MRKGETTKHSILDQAIQLASQTGLEGLSIGSLAARLSLSKSGLFSHFRSKEVLQLQVLDAASKRFSDLVLRPAVQASRGEPRIRALFERWLLWGTSSLSKGGCLFIAASIELDDKAGRVRDHLVKLQKEWFTTRVRVFQTGIDEGHLRKDADPEQLAHDLFSIMLGCHYSVRLLKDPKAESRARRAFENLLQSARPRVSPKIPKVKRK